MVNNSTNINKTKDNLWKPRSWLETGTKMYLLFFCYYKNFHLSRVSGEDKLVLSVLKSYIFFLTTFAGSKKGWWSCLLEVGILVFNSTFNNISVISWRSFYWWRKPGKNHRPAASHGQNLLHNDVSSTSRLSRILTYNVSGDRHLLHRLVINLTTIRSWPRRPPGVY